MKLFEIDNAVFVVHGNIIHRVAIMEIKSTCVTVTVANTSDTTMTLKSETCYRLHGINQWFEATEVFDTIDELTHHLKTQFETSAY